MKNYKNYLIALLTGLLVLSLSTQQAQSAGKSKEAKAMEYLVCLQSLGAAENYGSTLTAAIVGCKQYRP